MADKKINELPDESGMTTADTDKLIFIGDPANGKLFKGIKPVGRNIPDLQQVTDVGNETTQPIGLLNAALGSYTSDGTNTVQVAPGSVAIKSGGTATGVIRATNVNTAQKNYELPNASGTLIISINNQLSGVNGNITIGSQEFADNAAAVAGGLTTGMIYRTGDVLKIVHS